MEPKKSLENSSYSVIVDPDYKYPQNKNYQEYRQKLNNDKNQNKNLAQSTQINSNNISIDFNHNDKSITFGQRSTNNSFYNPTMNKDNNISLDESRNINQLGLSFANSNFLEESNISLQKNKISKFLTDEHYITFVNEYGDNSCYVNVIIHLIHNISDINNILTSLYQIEEMKKSSEEKNKNEKIEKEKKLEKTPEDSKKIIELNPLLIDLGHILMDYESILNEQNKYQFNQITFLDTKKFRITLDKIGNGKNFNLNCTADPVELLTLILENLNKNYQKEGYNIFYLELVDKVNCRRNCPSVMSRRFDKDNFIHHIYIEELLSYISDNAIKFKNSKGDLFSLSYALYKDEPKECSRCNILMDKYLLCMNVPKFLFINFIRKCGNPKIADIEKVLFLISLEEDLNHLFICHNTGYNNKTFYNLLLIIFYSYSLCHYIIVIFNRKRHLFVIYDDEIVKEFQTIFEVYQEITSGSIRESNGAVFYPVLITYTRENIYNDDDINLNYLDEKKYIELINEVEKAQNDFNQKNTLTEEQKKQNLNELINAQKNYEKNKNIIINNINNIDNNCDNNGGQKKHLYDKNKDQNNLENFNFDDDEKQGNKNSINSIYSQTINSNNLNNLNSLNKAKEIYGQELLTNSVFNLNNNNNNMQNYKNMYQELNNINIDDYVINKPKKENNYYSGGFLQNISDQSNSSEYMNNNSMQNYFMRNDDINNDNQRLAQSQVLNYPRNFADLNNENNILAQSQYMGINQGNNLNNTIAFNNRGKKK